MGKASWDARVTGLGPRDVPENDKRRRVGQSVVDAAAMERATGGYGSDIAEIPSCTSEFLLQ